MSSHSVVTQPQLQEDFGALGVRAGDLLLVHSSLSSLGWVEGGADAVIDALLACLGREGTLFMPALSLGYFGPKRPPPPFDPIRTRTVVGRIPERFVLRRETIRSLHPTHSMAGLGRRAGELLRDHDLSPTPCGLESPWGRLARNRGQILMLGVDCSACTMFHGPEEQAEPDARCGPPTPCRIVVGEAERTVLLRLHRPYRGAISDRRRMQEVLRERGLVREGHVAGATGILIDAGGLWETSLRSVRARPSTTGDRIYAHARRAAERLIGRA